jgi:hypothetical protein
MLIYFVAVGNILHTIGIFYDHLVQFVIIRYVGTFFPVLVSCTKKNLATLVPSLQLLELLYCRFNNLYSIIRPK